MNSPTTTCRLALVTLLAASALCAAAEDTVTIPKSRLQELEREEQLLRQLKGLVVGTNEAALHTNNVAVRTNQVAITNEVVITNQALVQTNQVLVQTNQVVAQTNQVVAQTNQVVAQTNQVVAQANVVAPPANQLAVTPREEEEITRLKSELSRAQEQNLQLQKQHQADATKIASAPPAEAVVSHVSLPMSSLPPFQEGEMVDAMDLAGYYRTDPAAADQRYRNKKLLVRGEIARFEKALFAREYKIILKSADREIKVICSVYPPEDYKAVFTANEGSELVGLTTSDARVPILKFGDIVWVGGQCKGMRNAAVIMSGCELKGFRRP